MQAETGAADQHDQGSTALASTWVDDDGTDLDAASAAGSAYDAASLRSGLWWEGTRDGAVLMLHDLGVTPEGLSEPALAMYYEGFWTAAPLLPGHEEVGTTGRLGEVELADVLSTVDRWVAALQAATMPLVVMGCGLGASLAVLVATTYPVNGLVTVNLPVRSYHRRRFRSRFAALTTGRARGLDVDVKREDATEAQAAFLGSGAFSLARDLERLGAAELASVRVPTLMFQSRDDHVVSPADATAALAAVGTAARELVWLERSFHHAWLDYDAPLLAERAAGFVRALCDRPALPSVVPPADAAAAPAFDTADTGGFATGEWPAITSEQARFEEPAPSPAPGPAAAPEPPASTPPQWDWGWGGEPSPEAPDGGPAPA